MNARPSDFGGLFVWDVSDTSGGSLNGRRKHRALTRVVIVGANGAGKTWLARQIALKTGAPVIHNDALALLTQWQHRPRAEVAALRLDPLLAETWILEGGPSILTPEVLARATLVVWVRSSRWVRAWRILCRSVYYFGRTRPEHPPGNRDWPGTRQTSFLRKAFRNGADAEAAIETALSRFAVPVIQLRNTAEVSAFLKAARKGAERL